ncbi:hypothetical protein CesoFtcFv8_021622 [Champsocephalus esox]|uniref:Uncharacterized protein n=1 Tax=Champsocephalus esox TaxID=159716 RepID=A0AAN8B9L0_9TELE|nr:hypothetical protein CesoFtcFv8_021622 [Champsocephalus esox]
MNVYVAGYRAPARRSKWVRGRRAPSVSAALQTNRAEMSAGIRPDTRGVSGSGTLSHLICGRQPVRGAARGGVTL